MVFPDSKKRHRMLEQMATWDLSDSLFCTLMQQMLLGCFFLSLAKQCCVTDDTGGVIAFVIVPIHQCIIGMVYWGYYLSVFSVVGTGNKIFPYWFQRSIQLPLVPFYLNDFMRFVQNRCTLQEKIDKSGVYSVHRVSWYSWPQNEPFHKMNE